MTLAVCVGSKDGDIVMASDSQISIGPVRCIESKIKKIGTSTLWVASGDVSFINEVAQRIDGLPEKIKKGGLLRLYIPLINMLADLHMETVNRWKSMYIAFEQGKLSRRTVSCELLLADIVDGPKILHVSKCGNGELVDNYGFEAIGQAAPFANAVLEGYDGKNMTIEEAMVTIYCVMKRAISVGLYNLCEPINIWVIRKVRDRVKAYKLSKGEVKALCDISSIRLARDTELCSDLLNNRKPTSSLLQIQHTN